MPAMPLPARRNRSHRSHRRHRQLLYRRPKCSACYFRIDFRQTISSKLVFYSGGVMLKRLVKISIATLFSLALSVPAMAAADGATSSEKAAEFVRSLHFEQGTIKLPGDIATLSLP